MCEQTTTMANCPSGHETDRKAGKKELCQKLQDQNRELEKQGKPLKVWGDCGRTLEMETVSFIAVEDCSKCKGCVAM